MVVKAKLPLVMANDVKVRNINELKDNFNVEIVLGYFLDGKLKKWLEDRYYEEEAEAVEELDSEDPELAKKLCEIFEVEYVNKELDIEELALRNERIAKLKQLTADDEIIKNVDLVAFNQEELAALYDECAEKIYLCEGEFHIPKSKQEIEYVVICDAKVEGLCSNDDKATMKAFESVCVFHDTNVEIPIVIADKIALKDYLELDSYILFYKYESFIEKQRNLLNNFWNFEKKEPEGYLKLWNKINDEYFTLDIPDYEDVQVLASNGNEILVGESKKDKDKNLILFNIDTKQCEIICTDFLWNSNPLVAMDNKHFAYRNQNCKIIVCDFKTNKKVVVADQFAVDDMVLSDEKLYYSKRGKLYCYDVKTGHDEILYNGYCDILKIMEYNEKLYLLCKLGEIMLIEINLDEENRKPIEIMRISGSYHGCGWFNTFSSQKCPYLAFVEFSNSFPIVIFDIRTKKLKQVAKGCGYIRSDRQKSVNDFQVVGDYLYFEQGEERRVCRVELKSENSPVTIVE